MSGKINIKDESFSSYGDYISEIKRRKSLSSKKDREHPLRVTDHAVSRYVERTGDRGVTRGDIREIIRSKIDSCQDRAHLFDGITKVWLDEKTYFVIKDNKVLTLVVKD